MIKIYELSLLKILFLILLWIGNCNASEQGPIFSSINERNNIKYGLKTGEDIQDDHKRVGFLTDVNVAFEIADVLKGDYAAKTAREIQFDAIKIGKLNFHFGLREDILFNSSPAQLDHVINYLKTGYEIFDGRIILLWDHTCHNPSIKLEEGKRNEIHWNELGIGYESNGMMLGHKGEGITFSTGSTWINNINWKASMSKIWMRTENDYDWILKIGIRDDLFRVGRHVFYTLTNLETIYDHRGISFNSNLEVGDRYHFNEHSYLIAFLNYRHFNDWYDLDYEEDIFSAGLVFEMGLRSKSPPDHSDMKERNTAWDPGLSVTGGYSNILGDNRYGHSSDFSINLNLFKVKSDILVGVKTYTGIITIPGDLNPHWVKYEIEPSLRIDIDEGYLNMLYSYSSLYSVENDQSMKDYHKLSLEITKNMWTHWDINAGFGAYLSTSNFKYNGEVFGDLTFRLNPKGISPYLNCSFNYLEGRTDLLGYGIETGIIIPGEKGSCNIYWRQQDDMDIFRYEEGKRTFLGIGCGF